ncbi:MAG: hypothetical protein WCL50_18985 [Spirochaetota bacterium]
MKRSVIAIALVFLASVAVIAAPYDKAATVTVMRANVARMQAIKAAAAAGDFNAAAQAFFDYAKAAQAEIQMDPPKGSKDDWIQTWQTFVDDAYRGVGACADKDAAKVLKALDELVSVNKHGHSTFRF